MLKDGLIHLIMIRMIKDHDENEMMKMKKYA